MGFDEAYAARLAEVITNDLGHSLRDYAAIEITTTVLPEGAGVEVKARRPQEGAETVERFRVDHSVYGYVPDGTAPERHGGWLSEWFQEEHTAPVHQGYHGPRRSTLVLHPDGQIEELSPQEAEDRFGPL